MSTIFKFSSDSHFKEVAINHLEELFEAMDQQYGDKYEIEFDGESINIPLVNGMIIINLHGPMQQIWLASPVSGAHHYGFDGQQWRNTREEDKSITKIINHDLANSLTMVGS